ncbi:hypothetical protein B5X24_HaOG212909 [Helicoverpa armigera]|nr:hypothetical protein B5X24_HaOG212909 [Helicoverpa armigera]
MVFSTAILRNILYPKTYFRYLNHTSLKDCPGEIRRFRPLIPEEEDLCARVTRFGKPHYCRIMCRSTAFIKNSLVPVRFNPEPSMHHPACTDFSRTRLHALPLTKSPEHPSTCVSPWRPFVGGSRWYADERNSGMRSVKDAAGRLMSSDVDVVVVTH